MTKAAIGIYGLGVMGQNLALNMEEHGYKVSLFNRTVPGKEEGVVASFLEQEGNEKQFLGHDSEKSFIISLIKPRKILLMVKAGDPVDNVIERLSPLLDNGDIIIDGGNSHYQDTGRRVEQLESNGLSFIGMGVSGGEDGARNGPSLMPGGTTKAWQEIRPILQSIAAKDNSGEACCSWIGEGGAGHFVKMVHNGIEYADMQLIAECYHIMKTVLHMSAHEIATVFDEWNQGALNSYLMEISAEILTVKDDDGSPLIEKILDAAGQKGTGLWTAVSALESGTPLPIITSAVFGRVMSSFKDLRAKLSANAVSMDPSVTDDKKSVCKHLEEALLAARAMALAEGFYMIQQQSEEYFWEVELAEVARIWQNGCIIRSKLLEPVHRAYQKQPELPHLLADDNISGIWKKNHRSLRKTISLAVENGIPCPAMFNALTYYDTMHSEWLPANMIQAQRDYFGAHTYERTDRPKGTFFHTDWKHKDYKS